MLAQARVGRLGLLDDDDAPRVLPVTFALNGGSLFTAVDEKRKRRSGEALARVRFLRRRPRAALTVDHYEDDWSALAWVQVLGEAQVLDAATAPDAIEALRAKYAQYREGPPAGPLIRLDPGRVLWWRSHDG
jgi:PPOX class probable F420-dependent enzyme